MPVNNKALLNWQVRCGTVWCSVVQYGTVRYGMVQYTTRSQARWWVLSFRGILLQIAIFN